MTFLIMALLCLPAAGFAEVRLSGRISSETGQPVSGAKITLRTGERPAATAVSIPTGEFECTVPSPGVYHLEVEREGFFLLTQASYEVDADQRDVQLVLNLVRENVQSVDVTANPGAVDMDRTSPQVTLSGNDIQNVPYPSTNALRNALRVMPGMVQDSRGGVHLHGGAEEQTLYTLEGFQINDPLTGRFETRLSLESIQNLEATAGRPSAEYGKGSAGVLAIRTKTGDDKLRYTATNFIPGVEYNKGIIIGGWTPRANVSGPLKQGKAWFSDSFDIQYINNIVPELPKGADRTPSWRWSNLLHTQINLSPSNILTIGSLLNYYNAPRSGLSVLDPIETTVDRRQRQWFTYVKDQMYFRRGALVEIGYAHNRTFARDVPQGDGLYIVSPFGKKGNNFVDATRKAGRDQWLANLFLPIFSFYGEHHIKGGIDLDRISYWQDVRRSGIEFATLEFLPVRRTVYRGSGAFQQTNFESTTYLQDSWRVRPGLLLELGARGDWDRLLRNWNFSPRLGFAWSPLGQRNTKFFGGFARIFDSTSLRVFTRPRDQYAISTYFSPDGAVTRPAALSIYRIENGNLATPRFHNWNIGFEHEWPRRIQSRVNFVRRRGSRGFTYVNQVLYPESAALPTEFDGIVQPDFDAFYNLSSRRSDRYAAVEIALRQPIRQQYEWMLSYTRSRARSNAVVDQSIDEPLLITDNAGPLPWDTPNRWLSWAYLPTPFKTWAFSYLVEWRTGFPYSVQEATGQVVGSVNELRFPVFFELNLHIEKRLPFRGQWWALRVGANNITNHRNPNVVNNVVGSSLYGQMFGGQRRSFNLRIRWLGKQ